MGSCSIPKVQGGQELHQQTTPTHYLPHPDIQLLIETDDAANRLEVGHTVYAIEFEDKAKSQDKPGGNGKMIQPTLRTIIGKRCGLVA